MSTHINTSEELYHPGKVIEFFAGIGGWHFAFNVSHNRNNRFTLPDNVISIEININSNKIYKEYFPNSKQLCKDIRYIKLNEYERIKADTWVLSPPCQPYTSLGKKLDVKDKRSEPLFHLCNVLLNLEKKPNYICFENVPGFYKSESHKKWIKTLINCGYYYCEFILSPSQFKIPNERLRYFCTARLFPWSIDIDNTSIYHSIPGNNLIIERVETNDSLFYNIDKDYLYENEKRSNTIFSHCYPLQNYLEYNSWDVSKTIKEEFIHKCSGYKHDLVDPNCKRSSCFTSGYTSSARGAGSLLFQNKDQFSEENKEILPKLSSDIIQEGKIRFFTPKEIANLMGFPSNFLSNNENIISTKSQYKVLGNSINVECASHVLDFLFKL